VELNTIKQTNKGHLRPSMTQLTRTINAEDAMDQVVLGHDHSLLIILEVAWDRHKKCDRVKPVNGIPTIYIFVIQHFSNFS
jgi:hypothetical protein